MFKINHSSSTRNETLGISCAVTDESISWESVQVMMKTLLVVSTFRGRPSRKELARMEAAGEIPRTILFEDELNADVLGDEYLGSLSSRRARLYRFVPSYLAQCVEAFIRRRDYDVVITWGEHLTLLFALLLKLMRTHVPHVALMYWISPPKKARLLSFVHRYIDRIVIWSSVQRKFAIEKLGIPPDKIVYVRFLVDQKFWSPMERTGTGISAVGNEQRDYVTLARALEGSGIQCRIVAGRRDGVIPPCINELNEIGPLPSNVVHIGWLPLRELRELYASSRFVVVPLHQTETNHGLTVMLEAMAMGKPVISSHTMGHEGVILPNETGILVPPGDPISLRSAMIYLWEHPEVAERMGMAARKYVERYHSFDDFVAAVKKVVIEIASQGSPSVQRLHMQL